MKGTLFLLIFEYLQGTRVKLDSPYSLMEDGLSTADVDVTASLFDTNYVQKSMDKHKMANKGSEIEDNITIPHNLLRYNGVRRDRQGIKCFSI